jgi:hypothetical protein
MTPHGEARNQMSFKQGHGGRWQSRQSEVMAGKTRGIRRFQLLGGVE